MVFENIAGVGFGTLFSVQRGLELVEDAALAIAKRNPDTLASRVANGARVLQLSPLNQGRLGLLMTPMIVWNGYQAVKKVVQGTSSDTYSDVESTVSLSLSLGSTILFKLGSSPGMSNLRALALNRWRLAIAGAGLLIDFVGLMRMKLNGGSAQEIAIRMWYTAAFNFDRNARTLLSLSRIAPFKGGDMENNLNRNVRGVLEDSETKRLVRDSLVVGYKNMGLPEADLLVDRMFREHFDPWKSGPVEDVFEAARHSLSSSWHGKPVKEWWSTYYRDVEAPFITGVVQPHIAGKEVLEVGTGRGWISYHLRNRIGTSVSITQTDVVDYREPVVRAMNGLRFVPVDPHAPLPFADNSFDTAVIVYVMHHVPMGDQWYGLLRQLNRVVRKKIIFLEDTYVTSKPSAFRHEQSAIVDRFMTLREDQKRNALSFLCSLSNRVDGGGCDVPTPCTFLEVGAMRRALEEVFTPARVSAEFLGIPRSKVYLNTEGLFVVEK